MLVDVSLESSLLWLSGVPLGGAAVMTNLVDGLSVEMATGMVVAVIGTYTFIGGLGATFYVSYFNTALIFIIMLIFLLKVYHDDDDSNPLGQSCYLLHGNKTNPHYVIWK